MTTDLHGGDNFPCKGELYRVLCFGRISKHALSRNDRGQRGLEGIERHSELAWEVAPCKLHETCLAPCPPPLQQAQLSISKAEIYNLDLRSTTLTSDRSNKSAQ